MRTYIALYNVSCAEGDCEQSPVVGLKTDDDRIEVTYLCGQHFFGCRSMVDPDEWNDQPESTE